MTCKKCGTILSENATFCEKCGERVERIPATYDTADTQNPPSKDMGEEVVREEYTFDKGRMLGRVTYKRIHTEVSVIDTGLRIKKTTKKVFRKAKEEEQFIPFEQITYAKIHTTLDYWDTLYGVCFVLIGFLYNLAALLLAAVFFWCGYGKQVVLTLRNGAKYSIPYSFGKNESTALVNRCVANISTSPTFEPTMSMPPLKTSRSKTVARILKILGAVVVAVAFTVIVVLANKPEIDYIATVKAHTPYADSLDLPYTYEEVLDYYISNAMWLLDESKENREITVFGEDTGGDNVEITIEVISIDNTDKAIITVKSVKIGEEEFLDQNDVETIMERLFQSYDERNKDSASIAEDESSSEVQWESKQIGDSISINETHSYNDNTLGNIEATLNFVEFTDEGYPDMWGITTYPDTDCIYLSADFSVKNLGTESCRFPCDSCRLIYDGKYEYEVFLTAGDIGSSMNPLTPPANGKILYMVPLEVMESGKSLFIVLDIGDTVLTYTINQGNTSKINEDFDNNTTSELEEDGLTDRYSTVKEFLEDPVVRDELNQMIESMMAEDDTMSISVDGGDDVLIYTYTFTDEALEGVYIPDLCAVLEESLESQRSTYEDIASSLSDAIEVENPRVTIVYTKSDGTVLVSREFEPNE